jgi:hypothetical protein
MKYKFLEKFRDYKKHDVIYVSAGFAELLEDEGALIVLVEPDEKPEKPEKPKK